MKRIPVKFLLMTLPVFILASCTPKGGDETERLQPPPADTSDATNFFYDNAPTYELPLASVVVEGEVENPGIVDFQVLPVRSVIVKETRLAEQGDLFTGAYRYDGYSMSDILDQRIIRKKNAEEFEPVIDLFVVIENEKGERAVISWGEIYYPNHLHEIIIAHRVMRIVPSKTHELWPLPGESKLVVGGDLITDRNILYPVRLRVVSHPRSFRTEKGIKPLFSPEIKIFTGDDQIDTWTGLPDDTQKITYRNIFYGRGRGIHSTTPFTGSVLKELLLPHFGINGKSIREGVFLITAADGYRGVFTFSEIMNRNDQEETLLLCNPEAMDDGIFRIFPAGDFFSDRAIKAVTGIYFSYIP
ncbi:MAG: hypothetical protein JW861_12750 [Bacteroidales bacterium]|nr:hypothetical protein [Bacteroidales bacterium]